MIGHIVLVTGAGFLLWQLGRTHRAIDMTRARHAELVACINRLDGELVRLHGLAQATLALVAQLDRSGLELCEELLAKRQSVVDAFVAVYGPEEIPHAPAAQPDPHAH